MPWHFVTDYGDSAVTITLSVLTLGLLLWRRAYRTAAAWAIATAGTGVGVALVKLALQSCGHEIGVTYFDNPSGHVAMSTIVYGGLALLYGDPRRPAVRRGLFVVAAALVAAIAFSRFAIGAHNPAEIAIGFAVGLCFLTLLGRLLGSRAGRAPALSWWGAAATLGVVALMHGLHLNVEHTIRGVVAFFHTTMKVCV